MRKKKNEDSLSVVFNSNPTRYPNISQFKFNKVSQYISIQIQKGIPIYLDSNTTRYPDISRFKSNKVSQYISIQIQKCIPIYFNSNPTRYPNISQFKSNKVSQYILLSALHTLCCRELFYICTHLRAEPNKLIFLFR